MAILIDEYGGFSGLVTMEDLIEEIMGDIDDEYDHDEPDIMVLDNKNFYVEGSVSIKEFNSKTGLKLNEESEDYDTLGGYLRCLYCRMNAGLFASHKKTFGSIVLCQNFTSTKRNTASGCLIELSVFFYDIQNLRYVFFFTH